VKKKTPNIIELTKAFWAKRTGQEFSHEDARQMVSNVSGFFKILTAWDREDCQATESKATAKTGP
jgi:hypothetical protein